MNIVYLGAIGTGFVLFGIWLRLGRSKSFFLFPGMPVLMPRVFQYMLIPLGVTLIVVEIAASDLFASVETRSNIFCFGAMPLLGVSFVLALWNPRWLRPRWLVYLEDTYGSVMWRLLDEARKNIPAWTRRVRTQQGLEEWAEETYLRLGYLPRPGQIEREAKKRPGPT